MPEPKILRCARCGGDGPFSPSQQQPGKWCRACMAAFYREQRAKETPEQREARLTARRLKRYGRTERVRHRRSPEEKKALDRERARRYYLDNREERIAYQKARRDADREAARAYEREVYQRRREKHQATNRARARKMGVLDSDSLEFEAVLRGDPCCYCGGPMEHIDHIVPIASGGENHWTNLTAACQPCNREKWDKPLLAFLGGT